MMIEVLARTLLYYDVEIAVKALKDKTVRLPGGLEVRLRQGTKAKLPLFLAEELVESEVAEYVEEDLVKKAELKKQLWAEGKNEKLERLDDSFYLKFRLYVRALERRKNAGDRNAEKELEELKTLFTDLVRSRMRKIAILAVLSPEVNRDHMANMTREEQILYVSLCNLLNEWTASMRKFVMGE